MKELVMLTRETMREAMRIVSLRAAGENLPESKWLVAWSAAWSLLLVAAEQWLRHGWPDIIVVPLAWAGVVWMLSRSDGKTEYRIASSLLLASLPICAASIMVAGKEALEWAVSGWGAVVVCNVIVRHKKESLWL